jgi:hypothetical protein
LTVAQGAQAIAKVFDIRLLDKRAAQSKVVGMIRPKERVFSVYRDADGVSV